MLGAHKMRAAWRRLNDPSPGLQRADRARTGRSFSCDQPVERSSRPLWSGRNRHCRRSVRDAPNLRRVPDRRNPQ